MPKTVELDVDFPNPLPNLTIRIGDLLDDTAFCGALSCRPRDIAIQSVHTASQALESAVVFHSGEIVVYYTTPHSATSLDVQRESAIVSLTHIRAHPSRMSPYF